MYEAMSMEHAREIELIELAARRLDAEREKIVLAHLQDCLICRVKLQEITRTWDILGAWEVPPAKHVDVTRRAISSTSRKQHPARFFVRLPGIGMATRIAAAIVLAVLAGYEGGRWTVRPRSADTEAQPPQYVSVLGLEVGDSFSSLVLQDEPPSKQEG
jgi:predicted anti-sigma-YlaC factor YlaD